MCGGVKCFFWYILTLCTITQNWCPVITVRHGATVIFLSDVIISLFSVITDIYSIIIICKQQLNILYTWCLKNDSLSHFAVLNILYSFEFVAVKFWHKIPVATKYLHKFPPHCSCVPTLPENTLTPELYYLVFTDVCGSGKSWLYGQIWYRCMYTEACLLLVNSFIDDALHNPPLQ